MPEQVDQVPLQVQVDPELRQRLWALRIATGRTLSEMADAALREWLERQEGAR